MSRFSGLFWCVLALAAGMANFFVAHTVQGLDEELTNVQRKTIAAQKEIHELTADWTFLNQPELLADLNRRYVGLVPISPKQVAASIDDIPLRPAPPPAPPEPEVAAAPVSPPTAAPIPAAASTPARIVPVAAAATARPARPATLDALFAQVAQSR